MLGRWMDNNAQLFGRANLTAEAVSSCVCVWPSQRTQEQDTDNPNVSLSTVSLQCSVCCLGR